MVRAQHPDTGDPSLSQERLGLVEVLGVDRLGLLVRGVPLLDEAGCRRCQPGHGVLADLVVVQGVEHRLAGLDVGEGGVVEHGEEQTESLQRRDLDRFLEGRQVGRRDGVDSLHGARGHRVGAGGVIGHDVPLHGLDQRRVRTVVVVIALEHDDLLRRTVVRHLVGPAADRVVRELLGVGLDDRLGDDLDDTETLRQEHEGVLELEGDGTGILGLHLVDEGEEVRVRRQLLNQDTFEGVDDILSGHGRTVGELRILAQLHLIGGVVDLLGHLRRQSRVHLTGRRVNIGEPLHGVPVGRNRESGAGRRGVVAVGAQLVGDARGDDAVLVRSLAPLAARRHAGRKASSHAQGAGQPDEVAAAGARRSCDRH